MKYLIKAWETSEDRKYGESYIDEKDIDIDTAIKKAVWLINKNYAICAEVQTMDEKKVVFHYDEEDYYVSRKADISL